MGNITTLQADTGTLDADGNNVFNVTALPGTNNLNVVGAGNHGVVLNYSGIQGWNIQGNVTLSGGLTPDQGCSTSPGREEPSREAATRSSMRRSWRRTRSSTSPTSS